MKQSDKPKYIAHVLGGTISMKYRQYHCYDTPKHVVHELRGAVSKIYRRLPESISYRHVITILSRTQVVTAEAV